MWVRLVCHVHVAIARLVTSTASTRVEGPGSRCVRDAGGRGDDVDGGGLEMISERER